MLRHFHRQDKEIPTSTSPPTTSTSSAPTRLSPLDIPEILDYIFSFLDDSTICRSVAQVCQQWRLLNHGRIVREVTWNQAWSSSRRKKALDRLPGAGRMRIFLPDKPSSPRILDEVLRILSRFESEYQKQVDQRNRSITGHCNTDNNDNENNNGIIHSNNNRGYKKYKHLFQSATTPALSPASALCSFAPLKELELFISHYGDRCISIFPFPSTLTKITFKTWYSFNSTFYMDAILRRCPLLEHFSVEAHEKHGIWIQYTPIAKTSILRLRSLVLCNVFFKQEFLEDILQLTPDLKRLELRTSRLEAGHPYNLRRLFRHLKANNITLDKAHFSGLGCKMAPKDMHRLLTEVCPGSAEQTLWALDVTPDLLQSIFSPLGTATVPTLTMLEIWWKPVSGYSPKACCYRSLATAPKLIHQYLCDDDSPLRHLKTLKTIVQLEDLDIFGRAGYIDLDKQGKLDRNLQQEIWAQHNNASSSTSQPPSPPRIWRCRILRTLHIQVHASGHHKLQHPVH
ncbi:hypothetical protein BGZ95_006000, partial [Linnemannia exigua]